MIENRLLISSLKFSVIIPVLNEEGNLVAIYTRLTKVMEDLEQSYEIIFVDDGSTDRSFQILKDLHQKDSHIKVIRFTRNFGQNTARMAALDCCKGENIILMDADLQHQPEYIPKLLARLNEGYDIVYGVPRKRQDNLFKRVTSKAYIHLLAKLTGQDMNPNTSAFRVITRRVVTYIGQFRETSPFFQGLIVWLGFPYAFVEVEHGRRHAGKTKYNLSKLIKLASEGILSFSTIPLHLAGYLGFTVSIISFGIGTYMILKYLISGVAIHGYTSIIVSIFFLGGLTLIILWFMGLYISKIHVEVKKRPLYVIRDMIE